MFGYYYITLEYILALIVMICNQKLASPLTNIRHPVHTALGTSIPY